MSTRITQRLMTERSLSSLQLGLGRLADTQEKLSTGRAINRPSDSPTLTNDAMRLRAQISADAQYVRNAQDGVELAGNGRHHAELDERQRAAGTRPARAGCLDRLLRTRGPRGHRPGAHPDPRRTCSTRPTPEHLGRPALRWDHRQHAAYDATGSSVGDAFAVNRTVGDGRHHRGQRRPVRTPSRPAGDDLFTRARRCDRPAAQRPRRRSATASTGSTPSPARCAPPWPTSAPATPGWRPPAPAGQLQAQQHQSSLSDVENVDIAAGDRRPADAGGRLPGGTRRHRAGPPADPARLPSMNRPETTMTSHHPPPGLDAGPSPPSTPGARDGPAARRLPGAASLRPCPARRDRPGLRPAIAGRPPP